MKSLASLIDSGVNYVNRGTLEGFPSQVGFIFSLYGELLEKTTDFCHFVVVCLWCRFLEIGKEVLGEGGWGLGRGRGSDEKESILDTMDDVTLQARIRGNYDCG